MQSPKGRDFRHYLICSFHLHGEDEGKCDGFVYDCRPIIHLYCPFFFKLGKA